MNRIPFNRTDLLIRQRPKVAVVVPLANEESTIEELLDGILAHLRGHDRLYCVLDSVCRDSTLDRVRIRGQSDPRVRLVWSPENDCVVDAYFRGHREALAGDGEWILEMDGGLSHRPDQIPRFLDAMHSGVDFAAGSRFCPDGKYLGFGKRFLVSRLGTTLTNVLLKTRMCDMTSGFQCFSREALAHVVSRGVRSRRHFFQTEIRFMLRNWRWVEVPITYSNPSNRLGSASLTDAVRCLLALRAQLAAESRQGKSLERGAAA